ncbi:hypothetical protein GW17_00015090 [Ensete ventricosum]|nr:hypothetical protein GW17_00015090 [Ensete ventricosum]
MHVSGTVHVDHYGSSWSLWSELKSKGNGVEKSWSLEEEKAKINEVREILGPMVDMLPNLCSDASVSRYLRARNWNVEKASKMLKESLKWRLEYKPETIRWVVKPFLEHKTYKKVKFVYSDNTESQKIMTDLFEMDKLESAFGGHNPAGFDLNKYAEKMKEDDQKMSAFIESASSVFFQEQSHVSVLQPEFSVTEHQLESSSDSSPSSDVESPRTADTKNLSANEMKEQLNCKNTTIAESGVSRPLIHMNDFA